MKTVTLKQATKALIGAALQLGRAKNPMAPGDPVLTPDAALSTLFLAAESFTDARRAEDHENFLDVMKSLPPRGAR